MGGKGRETRAEEVVNLCELIQLMLYQKKLARQSRFVSVSFHVDVICLFALFFFFFQVLIAANNASKEKAQV